jgi:hypothetical protein|tara:strand:+ start:549 stop:824 length:276 start_codon:yes stop_codon:yes gene_type:complete
MINTSISYDENILEKGKCYSIGTNDGKEFRRVVYRGTKLLNGKPMMVFRTEDNSNLTVNPSFHTYTLEELPLPQPADLEVLSQIKGDTNNG